MGEKTRREIDFSVFLIHRLAESWGVAPADTYRALFDAKVLGDYIIPFYDDHNPPHFRWQTPWVALRSESTPAIPQSTFPVDSSGVQETRGTGGLERRAAR